MSKSGPSASAKPSFRSRRPPGMIDAVVDRRALSEAVTTAMRAVPSRSALPIQSHLLLVAEENRLRVTGSDYELQIERTVDAQVVHSGSATVLARVFADLVGALPAGELHLAAEPGDRLRVSGGSGEYRLLGLPAEEFPPLPEVAVEQTMSIPGSLWRELVHQTAFAASEDLWRPQLTGLNVTAEGLSIKICGAEMARLALRSAELIEPVSGRIDAIVPARAMVEVSRILGSVDDDTPVQVGATQNQVVFRLPHVVIVSRLIDGKFPQVDKYIPREWNKRITVSTDCLAEACRRSLAVAGDGRCLLFSTSEGQLHIKAESGGTGQGHEVVEVSVEGDDIEIAFDGKRLIEFLAVVSTQSIAIEMTAPLSPGVFRPINGEALVYVQTPLPLNYRP